MDIRTPISMRQITVYKTVRGVNGMDYLMWLSHPHYSEKKVFYGKTKY